MLFQKRTSANVPAVRGRNLATVRPNDAYDVLPHSAENGASTDTNNSISVKSAKWTVFPDHVTYIYVYFRPYVMHVPLTRNAQTSDRPVEVQWCKVNIIALKTATSYEAADLLMYL